MKPYEEFCGVHVQIQTCRFSYLSVQYRSSHLLHISCEKIEIAKSASCILCDVIKHSKNMANYVDYKNIFIRIKQGNISKTISQSKKWLKVKGGEKIQCKDEKSQTQINLFPDQKCSNGQAVTARDWRNTIPKMSKPFIMHYWNQTWPPSRKCNFSIHRLKFFNKWLNRCRWRGSNNMKGKPFGERKWKKQSLWKCKNIHRE